MRVDPVGAREAGVKAGGRGYTRSSACTLPIYSKIRGKWHVSPVVRRPDHPLAVTVPPPSLTFFSLAGASVPRLPRLPNASLAPRPRPPPLSRFRYSRSRGCRSLGASLASSRAPLSDFNVVRLRASNQKHERYFCTWSPLFSPLLRSPRDTATRPLVPVKPRRPQPRDRSSRSPVDLVAFSLPLPAFSRLQSTYAARSSPSRSHPHGRAPYKLLFS